MYKKIKYLLSKPLKSLDEHTLEVVIKSSSSLIVKVIGMIAGFLLSIFLGRTLGADGLGVINLSNSLINIFLIIGMLGTRQIIVKDIAINLSNKNFEGISSTMKSAYKLNGGFTFVTSITLIFLTPLIVDFFFNDPRLKWPLTIGLLAATPQIFSTIWSSGLVGYRKIWQSNLVNKSLSIIITGIILVLLWLSNIEVTILNTAIAYAIGQVVVTAVMAFFWNKFSTNFKTTTLEVRSLFNNSFPLLISSLSNVLISNADIILLGMFLDTTEVGLYAVASRIAMLSSFMLQITNAALSGNLASLYSQNKKDELQKMVGQVTKYLMLFAIIPLTLFFIFGYEILNLWGSEFKASYWVLIIIAIGQFFNIATGAAGQLLIMCGYHKQQSILTTSFMFINIVLNLILIKYYGTIGAALATAITIAGLNISRVIVAKKKTGILTIPFL